LNAVNAAQHRRVGLWLVLGVTLAYLTTAGGSMTSTDGVVAFNVTQNLVEAGSIATSGGVIELPAYRGRGGRFYSPFGIAQSIWNIPFYFAGRAVDAVIPTKVGRSDTITKAVVALGTGPAAALMVWSCFALLVALGVPLERSVAVSLLLAFATPLWPYSGFGFNQPLTGMFLWLALFAAVAGTTGGIRIAPLIWCGVAAGAALLTRHEMMLAAAVIAAWLAVRSGVRRRGAIAAYLAGYIPMLLVWGGLNWWRFGNPLESGYLRDPTPGYGSSLLTGASGLLFSPYSSIFIYCPVALLVVAAMPAFWQRRRTDALLLVAVCGAVFLLYASLANWMGARSYGPRYLVPLLPMLVIPLAFWTPGRTFRPVLIAVIVLSILVQVPGVLVDYSKVREERAAAGETVAQDMRWSGMPLKLNARASVTALQRAVRHLSSVEPLPSIDPADPGLSRALTFSLDIWWINLFYLRIIGRATAIAVGVTTAAAAAAAIYRALSLARRADA
jgi:hypothetical protein